MQDYFYFLNRKNVANGFRESLNSRFFVDKSMLIQTINEKISTKEKWVCLSRPRRFGKTMAVEMLAAYYTKGLNTDFLFEKLQIKSASTYYEHLNAHNVIMINFNDYFENNTVKQGIERISQNLIHDLGQLCPGVLPEGQDLVLCLDMIEQMYGYKFIF